MPRQPISVICFNLLHTIGADEADGIHSLKVDVAESTCLSGPCPLGAPWCLGAISSGESLDKVTENDLGAPGNVPAFVLTDSPPHQVVMEWRVIRRS